MVLCKNCGKELPEGARFCTSCGTPCEGAAAQTAAPQPDASEGAKEVAAAEASKAAEAAPAAGAAAPTAEAPKAEGTAVPTAEAPKAAEGAAASAAEAPKAEGAAAPAVEAPKAAEGAAAPAAEPLKAAETPGNAAANGDKPQLIKPEDKKKLIYLGCGVAALIVLIVFCNLIFSSSPKKAFKAYVTGQYTCDYKKVLNNSIFTKKAMKALDLYDKDDYEDDYEDLKDYYEDLKDDWKDDDIKYKVSIDIKDVEKIKKSDREFKWAKEFMEDYYDCDADKIKQFAIVEARVKAEYYEDGDRDKDYDVDTGRTQYLLVKIGGNWYMTEYSRDDIKDYLKYYK